MIELSQNTDLPAPGLWNIPSGWANIEIALPKLFGPSLRTRMRLKQGMIAIADNPTHSTAHLSLDAASLRTGNTARDRYLHDEVLNTGRYATIPVRIAAIEHCGGQDWKADGWITVGGVSTPIELDVNYAGLNRAGLDRVGSVAHFRARASLPLRSVLGGRAGIRSRYLATRQLRITIDIHAEPVRASHRHHPSRAGRHLREVSWAAKGSRV